MGGKYAERQVTAKEGHEIWKMLSHVFPRIKFVVVGTVHASPDHLCNDIDFLVSANDVNRTINGHGARDVGNKILQLKHAFVKELMENIPGMQFHHMSAAVHMSYNGVQLDFCFVPEDADINKVKLLFDPTPPWLSIHQQIVRQYLIKSCISILYDRYSYNIYRGLVGIIGKSETLVATSPDEIQKHLGLDSFTDVGVMVAELCWKSKECYDELDQTLRNLKNKSTSINELLAMEYAE